MSLFFFFFFSARRSYQMLQKTRLKKKSKQKISGSSFVPRLLIYLSRILCIETSNKMFIYENQASSADFDKVVVQNHFFALFVKSNVNPIIRNVASSETRLILRKNQRHLTCPCSSHFNRNTCSFMQFSNPPIV